MSNSNNFVNNWLKNYNYHNSHQILLKINIIHVYVENIYKYLMIKLMYVLNVVQFNIIHVNLKIIKINVTFVSN